MGTLEKIGRFAAKRPKLHDALRAADSKGLSARGKVLERQIRANVAPIIREVPRLSSDDVAVLEREVMRHKWLIEEDLEGFSRDIELHVSVATQEANHACAAAAIKRGSAIGKAIFISMLGFALIDRMPIESEKMRRPWNTMLQARPSGK